MREFNFLMITNLTTAFELICPAGDRIDILDDARSVSMTQFYVYHNTLFYQLDSLIIHQCDFDYVCTGTKRNYRSDYTVFYTLTLIFAL